MKNSSANSFGTCANSSKKIILKDEPLTAEDDVAAANTFEPFSNSIFPLFQANIPCCNHMGKFSYDNFNLSNNSLARDPLLASIPT